MALADKNPSASYCMIFGMETELLGGYSIMKNPKGNDLTMPGSINRNGQQLVRFVRKGPSNPLNRIYKLSCTLCAFEYSAYGSDLWQRKCPSCQNGREGLPEE